MADGFSNIARGLPWDFSHLGGHNITANSHNQPNSSNSPHTYSQAAITAGSTRPKAHEFADTWCKYIKAHESQATTPQATVPQGHTARGA